jgi:hypothetical protein
VEWRRSFLSFCLAMALAVAAGGQAKSPEPTKDSVVVPAPAAALVRPILDEEAGPHDERHPSDRLYDLTQKKGPAADEALVVLMCFDVGESQEEVDAVIARGKKMLPILKKYQNKDPRIPGRSYPRTLYRGVLSKDDAFQGAVKAIHHGWHSTADNPGM